MTTALAGALASAPLGRLLTLALLLRHAVEFLVEAEVTEVGDPHRVENAIQMIVFVLDDPGVKARGLTLDHGPVAIHAAVADPPGARHDGAQLRDRQATFPARNDLLANRLDACSPDLQPRGIVALAKA